MTGLNRNYRALQAWATILRQVGRALNMAHVGRTTLRPNSPRGGVQRLNRRLVNVGPLASVELRNLFMNATEAISMEPRAVMLLPDQVLRHLPPVEHLTLLKEEPKRAKAPENLTRQQGNPAGDAPVPLQRRLTIGRIGDNDVDGRQRRQDFPTVPVVNRDAVFFVIGSYTGSTQGGNLHDRFQFWNGSLGVQPSCEPFAV